MAVTFDELVNFIVIVNHLNTYKTTRYKIQADLYMYIAWLANQGEDNTQN